MTTNPRDRINSVLSACAPDGDEKGKAASSGTNTPFLIAAPPPPPPAPTVVGSLGSPTALAIGAFSTTLTTLSLSLMGWRGVSVTDVFVADFLFVAGIGMLISANWELVKGNSFGASLDLAGQCAVS